MSGSIGSIILSGFGNGTFAGTPSLIVTMGYGVGAAAIDYSPWCVIASQYHAPGSVNAQSHSPGSVSAQTC